MIDRTTPPNPAGRPVAHVYVQESPGVCVCGRPRFTAVHVANDGTPEADLGGIEEQLDAIVVAVDAIRTVLRGVPDAPA